MKILICSHLFAPSVGGIESMSGTLAHAWQNLGHEVRVVTTTPGSNSVEGVLVIRNPNFRTLWRETRWSDLCFHNNISLKWAWSPLVARRPWVVTHQTWMAKANGTVGWQERAKKLVIALGRSVAISEAVAAHISGPSSVIPNAYDEAVFFGKTAGPPRDLDLVFVGRFVSDKGGDLLLRALGRLAERNVRPRLTMIGDGPERVRWYQLAAELGLGDQVRWTGALQGADLAQEMRRHTVMVVPSRWAEPFGIVALEGAACGCLVLGSSAGGLKEAIGPGGATFTNGDETELVESISRSLKGEVRCDSKLVELHLRAHRAEAVAGRYLELFKEVMR